MDRVSGLVSTSLSGWNDKLNVFIHHQAVISTHAGECKQAVST